MLRDHRPLHVLLLPILLQHLLADRDHVFAHDARHHGQQRPRRVHVEKHEEGPQERHLPEERLELQEAPATHRAEEREHALVDRREHGLYAREVLVIIHHVAQEAVADEARTQDRCRVQRHDHEHEHPEHALQRLHDAHCELEERAHDSDQAEKTDDAEQPAHTHQHEDDAHMATFLVPLRVQTIDQRHEPRVGDAAHDDAEIEEVPDPLVFVLEEVESVPDQSRQKLEDEEGEQQLFDVPPERACHVSLQANDQRVHEDYEPAETLEPIGLHPRHWPCDHDISGIVVRVIPRPLQAVETGLHRGHRVGRLALLLDVAADQRVAVSPATVWHTRRLVK
mmetsp:Transcript_82488/g.229990  ORF Transcript_82488/g.229990 Transcript_82488/m.229990 type:complete len:338 (-) Transcript_82488:330-1343(-)